MQQINLRENVNALLKEAAKRFAPKMAPRPFTGYSINAMIFILDWQNIN